MPHQCVRCSKMYDDGNTAILHGCDCGGKLFFYIKKERIAELQKEQPLISKEQRLEIEKDVFEMLDLQKEEKPVVLDLESIRILSPGKYELDLVSLFKGDPVVFKLEEGKYVIDLAETFERFRRKK